MRFAAALLVLAATACTASTTKSLEAVDAATPGPDQPAGAACDPSLDEPCLKTFDGCSVFFCDTTTRTCSSKPSGICTDFPPSEACEPATDGSCPVGCNAVTGTLFSFERDCSVPGQKALACSNAQGGSGVVICEVNTATHEAYGIGDGPLLPPSFPDWRRCTDAERAAFDQALVVTCSSDAGSPAPLDAARD